MKRTIFSLVAGAGLIFAGAACERHPASELEGGEGAGAKEEETVNTKETSTPKTPEGVPANPAGAAPVSAPKPEKEAAAKPVNPAPAASPKFFPESK
jgi:hypothetical protein